MTTAEKTYAEMSVDELKARSAELRSDLADVLRGERNAESSEKMKTLSAEAAAVDVAMTLAYQGERRDPIAELAGPMAATRVVGNAEEGIRSGGELLVAHQGVRSWIEGGMASLGPKGMAFTVECGIDQFELPVGGIRAPYLAFGTGGPGNDASSGVNALLPVGQPIAPAPRRAKLYLRDLIPVQPTTLAQIPYVRELTPEDTEGGATAVAEGGLKPDTTDEFDPAVAYVTVIAGNVSPSKQLWEDAPFVAAYINQRLPYKVKLREDAQFLRGPGGYPNIEGILTDSAIQTQAATAGDPAITIGNAIAKVELKDGEATAVVMYPTDAWGMFTHRAAGGSGTFDAGTPFSNIPMTVWGLPVYRTRVMTSGHALVADFARGFLIADRQQVNVRVYDQHEDYAAHNLLLVQAEERVGLLKLRPDLAVDATL